MTQGHLCPLCLALGAHLEGTAQSNGHKQLQLTAFLPIAVMTDKGNADFFWTLKGEAGTHSSFCRAYINTAFGHPYAMHCASPDVCWGDTGTAREPSSPQLMENLASSHPGAILCLLRC